MKKLFEMLLIGVFSIVFSGSLFSNTFTKTSENGAKTDFIQPFEINENLIENVVTNPTKSRTNYVVTTARDKSYAELVFDVVVPETQLEISMVNNKSDTVTHSSFITLEEETFASFRVFPNPATEKLFVRFNGWEGIKEIKMLDITGRTVLIIKSGEELNEIDISTFPKGIYLIAVKNEFHYEVKKIKIQ